VKIQNNFLWGGAMAKKKIYG